MFLYELALQLGVRSTDLVARARQLGMDVEQGSFLDQAQVAHLWGSYQLAPAAPEPTDAPPPDGAPRFVPPAPWSPAPGGAAPVPGSPPHGWGEAADPTPAAAVETGPRSSVVVAAVAALVVLAGVLVFLASGSDDDGSAAPRAPVASAASTTTAAPTSTTTTTAVPADDPVDVDVSIEELTELVRDRHRFCLGARGIYELEFAVMVQAADGDLDGMSTAIEANRASWETAVEDLDASTTGILQSDVARYVALYRNLFDVIFEARAGSLESLAEFEQGQAQAALSTGRINAAAYELCA